MNWIVTALRRLALLASVAVSPCTAPLPRLASALLARTGAAAAMRAGSVMATRSWPAASAVGWIRKRSPAAGVPLPTTIAMPSVRSGSALLPLPVKLTLLPSRTRVSCQTLPL